MNWAWVPQVPQRINSAVVSDPQKKTFVPMISIAAPVYYAPTNSITLTHAGFLELRLKGSHDGNEGSRRRHTQLQRK